MVVLCPLMLTCNCAEKDCCSCGLKRTPKRACWEGGTESGREGRLTTWNADDEAPLSVTALMNPVPAPELEATMVIVATLPDRVLGNGRVELFDSGRTLLVLGSM